MNDRPVRAVAQELVNDLDVLAGQVRKLVEDEIYGSTMVGRSYEASGKTGFTPDKEGNPSGPTETRAAKVDPVLSKAIPKLKSAISEVSKVESYLCEPDPDRVPCKVCGCNGCRAVHPRGNPRRCDSCQQFVYRHNRDRKHEEVQEHKERMRYRDADRADQRRQAG